MFQCYANKIIKRIPSPLFVCLCQWCMNDESQKVIIRLLTSNSCHLGLTMRQLPVEGEKTRSEKGLGISLHYDILLRRSGISERLWKWKMRGCRGRGVWVCNVAGERGVTGAPRALAYMQCDDTRPGAMHSKYLGSLARRTLSHTPIFFYAVVGHELSRFTFSWKELSSWRGLEPSCVMSSFMCKDFHLNERGVRI